MALIGPGKLIVKPMSAKLTHDTETFGKMDPYCKISLGAVMKRSKTHQEAGKYPTWNDTFNFQRNSENFLNIEVWDEDTVSSDDLIGETSIALGETFDKKKTQNWHVLSYKGKEAGKILVSLEFVTDAPRQPTQNQAIPTMNYSYSPNTIPMMGVPPAYGYGYPGMASPYGSQVSGPYQGGPRTAPPVYGTQYPPQYGYPPGNQYQSQAPQQYPPQYPPQQYQQPQPQFQQSQPPQYQQSQPSPQYQQNQPPPQYQQNQPPPQFQQSQPPPQYQQPPAQYQQNQPPPQYQQNQPAPQLQQSQPPQYQQNQPPPQYQQNQSPPQQSPPYQQNQPPPQYQQGAPQQNQSYAPQGGYQQPSPQNQQQQGGGGYPFSMLQTINIPDNSDPSKQLQKMPTVQQPAYEPNIPKAQPMPQQGYPPQQQGGYPPQQQGGYSPQQQGGYPQQGSYDYPKFP